MFHCWANVPFKVLKENFLLGFGNSWTSFLKIFLMFWTLNSITAVTSCFSSLLCYRCWLYWTSWTISFIIHITISLLWPMPKTSGSPYFQELSLFFASLRFMISKPHGLMITTLPHARPSLLPLPYCGKFFGLPFLFVLDCFSWS